MAAAIALTTVCWLSAARADMVPEGYVEHCTLDEKQESNEACEECRAWLGDREACSKEYNGTELSNKCRTIGASTWTEIWCRPLAPGESPPPPRSRPPSVGSKTGCGGCAVESDRQLIGPVAALAAFAAIGGLVAFRSRRRAAK